MSNAIQQYQLIALVFILNEYPSPSKLPNKLIACLLIM